jgi:hypothetical protein
MDIETLRRYYSFIDAERKHYQGDDNNRFAFSFGQSLTYYQYLLIIKNRYDNESKIFQSINKKIQELNKQQIEGSLTNDNISDLMTQMNGVTPSLHLDIESFYLFSRITMDLLSRFFEDYFGKGRKCSLDSHHDLTKNFTKFAEQKNLTDLGDFLKLADELSESIKSYRDDYVAHHKDPGAGKGMVWQGDQIRIAVMSFSNGGNFKEPAYSTDINVLFKTLDDYFDCIIRIIITNRSKTRLQLV